MRISAVVWGLSSAALSLTLAAKPVCPAMPAQAQTQSDSAEKRGDSKSQGKESNRRKEKSAGFDSDPETTSHQGIRGLGEDFLLDQKAIWTSPAKLRFSDTQWLVPIAGITAGLFVTDVDYSAHLSHSPSSISHYKTLSDAGIGALAGGAAGMWLLGHVKHNEHWSETGLLAGEAALNSLVMVEGMKYSLGRERPYQGNGSGPFFQGGTSFPSEHAAAAWSVAGVIAHEYPGPLSKIAAYSLAGLVDFSRIKARQHFPSDVFVGSVLGNLVAQNIYSRRHDPELGGGEWRSLSEFFRIDGAAGAGNQGTPYVPLDSWIYPAFDRLIGMGKIDTGNSVVRPWTRSECARMLSEASDNFDAGPEEAAEIYRLLETEFMEDLEGAGGGKNYRAQLESAYSRVTGISGKPLTGPEGFTFGQTLINDFGRPYQEGVNSITGFSAWTTAGRWVGYVRGEYQQSPSAPPLSESERLTMGSRDPLPGPPPATPQPALNQFELLDAYVGLNFDNWQVTFGQQSLWWGNGDGGPMLFSNNAQPIEMFRVNRISPLHLPSFLRWLGPMRTEFFFGQFAGHRFTLTPSGLVGQYGQVLNPQPFVSGQLISFKPARDIEFAFFRTTVYGGPGYPLTFHTLIRSLFSTGNESAGGASKPGDRRSGLSFSYRLPKLRDWLTLYADGFTDDEYSPIAYVDVSAWHAGLFLSHFPHFSRLDLRAEGVYTDVPGGTLTNSKSPGSFYQNGTWWDGWTNNGYLIGSWIGRGGQGAQAWSNYWFTPRSHLQVNFRHQKVSNEFIPGGGSLTDFGVLGSYSVRSDLSISISVQRERWLFPQIQPNISRNVTASAQILFEPHKLFRHSAVDDQGGQR